MRLHLNKFQKCAAHIDAKTATNCLRWLLTFVFIVSLDQSAGAAQSDSDVIKDLQMAYIEAGSYTSLFKQEEGLNDIWVDSFYMDQYQVTNGQFAEFIKRFPKWSPENIKPIFSDSNYLKQLVAASVDEIANQPVTNVSWFAAKAYCKSLHKRLPSLNEWEYVGQASESKADGSNDPAYRAQILEWYARPSNIELPDVSTTHPNYWKVFGMHGVVWELVSDFNSSLVTGESRGDSQLEQNLFCGAGAASSVDPSDYAAFMRYALRSSYEAHYTLSSLGFRCARDAKLIADGLD